MFLQEQIFRIAGHADAVVIWLLVAMSVLALGVSIERYIKLSGVYSSSARIRHYFRGHFNRKSDLKFIEDIARDHTSVEGRAVDFALDYMKKNGTKGLDEAFTSFQLSEKPELERSVGLLATIGSNAPFVGLLGTVLGIMKAFGDLAEQSQGDQNTVMAGISMALTATAIGLFVAIPSVMAFNYFQKRVSAILENLENCKELCLAYGNSKRK